MAFAVRAVGAREFAGKDGTVALSCLSTSDLGDCGDDLSGHPHFSAIVVSSNVVDDQSEERCSALGLQRVLGLNSYETAWTWLHKLRRAMVRPGRDLLTGRVEVDECYIGGLEESLPGRLNLDKALMVVAAQEDGPGIGRIRMRQIVDASAASLMPFVQDSVEPGSVIHTDGWLGYAPLEHKGYKHEVTFLKRQKENSLGVDAAGPPRYLPPQTLAAGNPPGGGQP